MKLEPRSADAYRELATAFESTGKPDEAEATYKRAIELQKDNWSSLKQLGVFYFNHGRYAEAEQYFREVIRLTPGSAKAYSNLGAAYLKDGRKEDALLQLEHSVSIEPSAVGCSNLGSLYYFEGRYADAAAQYLKAAELNPTESRYWGNLADAYRWTPALAAKAPEAYRHAIALTEKEIAINPRDAQLHARVATSWAALGDRGKSGFGNRAGPSALLRRWIRSVLRRAGRRTESSARSGLARVEVGDRIQLFAGRDSARAASQRVARGSTLFPSGRREKAGWLGR